MAEDMFDFDLQLFAGGEGSEGSAGDAGGNPAGATDAGGGENKPTDESKLRDANGNQLFVTGVDSNTLDSQPFEFARNGAREKTKARAMGSVIRRQTLRKENRSRMISTARLNGELFSCESCASLCIRNGSHSEPPNNCPFPILLLPTCGTFSMPRTMTAQRCYASSLFLRQDEKSAQVEGLILSVISQRYLAPLKNWGLKKFSFSGRIWKEYDKSIATEARTCFLWNVTMPFLTSWRATAKCASKISATAFM